MRIRVALAILCVIGLFAMGCGNEAEEGSGKMLVAASIAPLSNFAKQIGGDLVKVEMLVPPGANPHTYQVEPAQMRTLSKASVLVLNGLGLEFWADKAVEAAANKNLLVVETAEGLTTIHDADEHHEHAGESHGAEGNPHVWLDPTDAIHQVEKIRDAFAEADPRHAETYRANADRFIADLKKLDANIKSEVAGFTSKSFVAFHPTWTYFARRYGLDEAAIIEESPGKESSPETMRHAIETARKLKARAVFAEPQMAPKAAQVVAEEVGAKVLLLDAFGEPPEYDYIEMMRSNVKKMAEALR